MVETREIEIPVVLPTGAECARCVERLRAALANVDGVFAAQVDMERSLLRVAFDPDELSIERLQQTAEAIGVGLGERFRHENLPLEGMDCPDCAATLERAVSRLPGVIGVSVNFPASTMHIEYEEPRVSRAEVVSTIEATGYRVAAAPAAAARPRWWQHRPRELSMALSGALLLAGVALSLTVSERWPAVLLYALAIVVGGQYVARGAVAALRVGSLDMNVLMSLAVVGAAAIGDWGEAALVVFLFAVGNVLEDQALDRTRASIRDLIRLAPSRAMLLQDGREVPVPAAELHPGQVIAVRPGEAIPVDGVIVGGSSTVNQAPITGESLPVVKRPGDQVYAGTLNELGFLEVRVSKRAGESSIARIIELVESAQARKARTQRFMDRFAAYYTPVIILAAVVVAVVPPVAFGQPLAVWLYRALTLLLLGCPCSLVISTPVTVVSGITTGARHGVLIKGGSFLEQVAGARVLALDKTGTLTYGRPEVTEVIALGGREPAQVLRVANALETRSGHPLAAAVTRYAQQQRVRSTPAEEFSAVPGKGATGRVEGQPAYVGSPTYLQEMGFDLGEARATIDMLQAQGKTVILVAAAGELLGLLAVADTVREGTRETLRCLKDYGVRHLVMLTGDHPQTARALAAGLGVDSYQAGLLPEQKVEAVEHLHAQYGTVVMVGDGVNDAPALAAAQVGVAMGAAGSDTALETADVALMGDDLTRLPFLLRLGRATLALVKQNIALAVGLKAILLGLAVPGLLTLWLAVLGDVGVSLLVIGNGLRLLRLRPEVGPGGEPCLPRRSQ